MADVEPVPLCMAYLPRFYRPPALPTLDELAEGFQATIEGGDEPLGRILKSEPCVVVNGYLQNVMEARPWDFYPWVEGNGMDCGGFAINLTHNNAATRLYRLGPIKHRRFLRQKHERPLYFRNEDEAEAFLVRCRHVATMPKIKVRTTSPTGDNDNDDVDPNEGADLEYYLNLE